MDYKSKRLALGLSQLEVAKQCGLSLTGYQHIERGITKTVKAETQERLSKVLGEDK